MEICSDSILRRSVVSNSLQPHGLPGSSVHGIFQAILETVAISFSRDLPDPGIKPASVLGSRFFTTEPPGKPGE